MPEWSNLLKVSKNILWGKEAIGNRNNRYYLVLGQVSVSIPKIVFVEETKVLETWPFKSI
jgi:hypothetical protein